MKLTLAVLVTFASIPISAFSQAYVDSTPPGESSSVAMTAEPWIAEFELEGRNLATSGRNPYWILEPGYRLMLAAEQDSLQITVLDDTVLVGGRMTRVMEEREWEGDDLVEVSRNYFAICVETGDVFYFGEDVDLYKDGRVTGHEGAWRAYADSAKPGLIMPGKPVLGMRYYQEMAPKVALDRAEVESLTDALETPAGLFTNCLKTEETSGLKANEREFKLYAPGIGLIQDEDLLLVRHGFIKK